MSGVLAVISADVSTTSAVGPRKDYRLLVDVMGATVLDYSAVRRSPMLRKLAKLAGMPVAQAWLAFCRRSAFDAILTDGEHIGIPLALLLKMTRASVPHVTIGHRITATKKRFFFRHLKVHTHIGRIVLHARRQYELGVSELGISPAKLALMPYQVDTSFWHPLPAVHEERLVCSAGLEFRDYPTLMRAVHGLDVQVVIGAASHWSRRRNTAADVEQPANVRVDSFDYHALRELYAKSAAVIVPLDDTDFQAGITTILEAMAMAKPVIVTCTQGQTDVVEDRRAVTRGPSPWVRPTSLLRSLAQETNVTIQPNGMYVAPHDPDGLRRAIVYLLDHPDERRRLGAAGRAAVEQFATVDQYVVRLRDLVSDTCEELRQSRLSVPPDC